MATSTKKPAAKATAKKSATSRKATAKTSTVKQTAAEHLSFRPTKETTPFMTFQLTKQSLYWLILSVLVLGLGTWVMYLNIKIQNIYDQVEMNTYLHETYTIPQSTDNKPAQQ